MAGTAKYWASGFFFQDGWTSDISYTHYHSVMHSEKRSSSLLPFCAHSPLKRLPKASSNCRAVLSTSSRYPPAFGVFPFQPSFLKRCKGWCRSCSPRSVDLAFHLHSIGSSVAVVGCTHFKSRKHANGLEAKESFDL